MKICIKLLNSKDSGLVARAFRFKNDFETNAKSLLKYNFSGSSSKFTYLVLKPVEKYIEISAKKMYIFVDLGSDYKA